MNQLLLTPPVAFLLFFGLMTGFYLFLKRYSAKGEDHPEKHLPYSSGQMLPPEEVRISYKSFFRIGLLFCIVHVASLVISTLPIQWSAHQIGLLYLVGISISAFVLFQPTRR